MYVLTWLWQLKLIHLYRCWNSFYLWLVPCSAQCVIIVIKGKLFLLFLICLSSFDYDFFTFIFILLVQKFHSLRLIPRSDCVIISRLFLFTLLHLIPLLVIQGHFYVDTAFIHSIAFTIIRVGLLHKDIFIIFFWFNVIRI